MISPRVLALVVVILLSASLPVLVIMRQEAIALSLVALASTVVAGIRLKSNGGGPASTDGETKKEKPKC